MPQILSLRRLFSRLLTSDEVDDNFLSVATDFAGATDPAGLPGASIFPYMRWADTGTGWLKRRNAANTGWISEGRLLRQAMQLFSPGEIPTTNIGDIQVDGQGLHRWDGIAYARVRSSINERTDTATQVLVALGGLAANGAIIELGSNSNGTWIKYGDGTMFCFIHRQLDMTGAVFTSNGAFSYYAIGGSIPIPAAFITTPIIVSATFSDNDIGSRSAYLGNSGIPTTTSLSGMYLVSPNPSPGSASSGIIRFVIVGRWK